MALPNSNTSTPIRSHAGAAAPWRTNMFRRCEGSPRWHLPDRRPCCSAGPPVRSARRLSCTCGATPLCYSPAAWHGHWGQALRCHGTLLRASLKLPPWNGLIGLDSLPQADVSPILVCHSMVHVVLEGAFTAPRHATHILSIKLWLEIVRYQTTITRRSHAAYLTVPALQCIFSCLMAQAGRPEDMPVPPPVGRSLYSSHLPIKISLACSCQAMLYCHDMWNDMWSDMY